MVTNTPHVTIFYHSVMFLLPSGNKFVYYQAGDFNYLLPDYFEYSFCRERSNQPFKKCVQILSHLQYGYKHMTLFRKCLHKFLITILRICMYLCFFQITSYVTQTSYKLLPHIKDPKYKKIYLHIMHISWFSYIYIFTKYLGLYEHINTFLPI